MKPYQERARLLRAMAHPMRLEILAIVGRSDECVCHLSTALNKPQPYVSQQLAVLRKEGLIVDRKEGTNVFYGLADNRAAEQVSAVLAAVAGGNMDRGIIGRQRVAGCTCPKCEPDGACSSTTAAA